MQYDYFLAIVLGILPSILWLAFYLRKDIHPEPRKWILLIFFLGMAVAPIVVGIEWYLIDYFSSLNLDFLEPVSAYLRNVAVIFIGIAAVEEFFKYLVVRFAMKKNPVFDEPADAMIYMIVSALGFAAVENILIMHSFAPLLLFNPAQPLSTLATRFVGATFLHTLASGILGFYYALSLVRMPSHSRIHRQFLIIKGFALAVILHGAFNYFIIILKEPSVILFSIPLLIVSLYVMKEFKILQKIAPKRFSNQ